MKGYGKFTPSLIGMLVSKPNTVNYPEVRPQGADNYRGALRFNAEKCVGCRLCERGCPSNAIKIEKVGDKLFKAIVYMDKCIFCGQCVDSCRGALENSSDFELARLNREELKVEI
jgi:formate hydrogenlyase subunit 6